MERKLQITYKMQISDHDGYCSGAECEYSEEIGTFLIDVPEQADGYSPFISIPKWVFPFNEKQLPKELVPDLHDGSWYCYKSGLATEQGLDKHDWRFTVLSMMNVLLDENGTVLSPDDLSKKGKIYCDKDICENYYQ